MGGHRFLDRFRRPMKFAGRAMTGVRHMTETFPLDKAQEAYD
jgi:hypothetical protein